MTTQRSLFFLFAWMIVSNALAAQEEETTPLRTEVELGAVNTSGNTDAQSINFRGEIGLSRKQWEYGFLMDGLRSSQNGVLAAQRFYYVGNVNYQLNANSFIQSRVAHEDDRFSGYDSQSDFTLSFGRNLLRSRPNMNLTYEAGIGYRISQIKERLSRANFNDFDEAMFRLAGEYEWDLSESAQFEQTMSLETGLETSIIRSESSIEAQILDNLALRFSIFAKHQTVVPAGRKNTDTETAVTFVMNF
ncbi:MAG: hypothetical protein CMD92_05125 [Gammaproteobacteria bacterium]|nr:hypothetical protein [Gammaproteobacteria bacterium]HBW85105.1 hypothetical protein [Gammaproteobacteria bacterium]|tara:strand:+ start:1521 stop:2261 length:741 start_codon:yes stop_codon:yes gene_type:complete